VIIVLDASPFAGGTGILAGGVFLLVCLGVAFVAFKLLKRTVKMAFRIAIVAVILAIAAAGCIFFLVTGSSQPAHPAKAIQPK
jgi:hypothetical protein